MLDYMCSSCCRKLRIGRPLGFSTALTHRRSISQKYLHRQKKGAEEWQQQAEQIKAGKKESMLSLLEKRGYINSVVGERRNLDSLMTEKRIGAYVGIDPTGPSLHVGHLLPLMALFWLYIHGFHAITLLGGSTARIGDPTDRLTPRERVSPSERKTNMVAMHYQLKLLWANAEAHARFKYNYVWTRLWRRALLNNNTWLNTLSIMEFLKLVGSGSRIGTMLGRDTVKNKMQNGDGMSFSEFTYPLIQAWDWWHMYNTLKIQVQIGGSDQFGNILAGVDAVNHIRKTHYDPDIRQEEDDFTMKPMGFTVPLLTTASGEKFGKSAGNAVWLDPQMTSTFDLYQASQSLYFVRMADADVARYLRLLTFIPLPEIDQIITYHEKDPSKRTAQRRLGREVIEMVHGKNEADKVESESRELFRSAPMPEPLLKDDARNPDMSTTSVADAAANKASAMLGSKTILPRSLVYRQPIARLLFHAGLVSSRSEGNRLAAAGGAYIGSKPGLVGAMGDGVEFSPITNYLDHVKIESFIIDGNMLILRAGKWRIKILNIIDDDEFDKQGLDAPGWQDFKEGLREFADEEAEIARQENEKKSQTRSRQLRMPKARAEKLVKVLGPEAQKRFEDFMNRRYRAQKNNAPTYTDFLREEKARAPENAKISKMTGIYDKQDKKDK